MSTEIFISQIIIAWCSGFGFGLVFRYTKGMIEKITT